MYDAYWLVVILLIIIFAGLVSGYFVFTRMREPPLPPQVSKPPGCPNFPEEQLYSPDYPPPNRPPGPPFVP